MSILTVGYGGIRVDESNVWPCVAYIFFGSAVLAACVCILKGDVVDKIAAFRARELRRKGRHNMLFGGISDSTGLLNNFRLDAWNNESFLADRVDMKESELKF